MVRIEIGGAHPRPPICKPVWVTMQTTYSEACVSDHPSKSETQNLKNEHVLPLRHTWLARGLAARATSARNRNTPPRGSLQAFASCPWEQWPAKRRAKPRPKPPPSPQPQGHPIPSGASQASQLSSSSKGGQTKVRFTKFCKVPDGVQTRVQLATREP